jgi:hypothetical protein
MCLTQKVVCAAKHEKQQAIADCGCPLADALRDGEKVVIGQKERRPWGPFLHGAGRHFRLRQCQLTTKI